MTVLQPHYVIYSSGQKRATEEATYCRADPGFLKREFICLFVAEFLGCTSTGRVGLCFLWFYVQELPKAQPAVVLVLKRVRRWGNGL